jgi:hypothetical protein
VTFWSIAACCERDKGRDVITRKEFMADFGYQLEDGVAADAHDPMLSDGDAFASGPDLGKRLVNRPCISTRDCEVRLISGLVGGRCEGLPIVRQ